MSYKFLDNKYTKWYFQIIKRYGLCESIKGEKHHIIPRSLGGSNERSNIARITTRAHYVCHLLLPKMVSIRDDYNRMVFARRLMIDIHGKSTRWLTTLREEAFKLKSQKQKGRASSFSREDVVQKALATRRRNGTNPFITRNPMLCSEAKTKKVEKTSGANHYRKQKKSFIHKDSGQCTYATHSPGDNWIQQSPTKGKKRPKAAIPKKRLQCQYCDKTIPAHLMSRHTAARHEDNKS